MNVVSMNRWTRRAAIIIVVLVVLAPVFGVAANAVGYTEPLEIAAERAGAVGAIETIYRGVFPDYAVPGLDSPAGTLLSAAIGTIVTLGVALGAGRLLEQ